MTRPQSKFSAAFSAAFSSGRYMKATPQINGLSVTSVMLQMFFRDQLLAKGTGWFWRLGKSIALVTAWHNLSGLHHSTRAPLSRHGGVPDRVRFRYVTQTPQTFQEDEIPLYLDEDRTNPRWFVHPVCGNYFDMAFIVISITNGDVKCINDGVPVIENYGQPGGDVFAVGFAQGISALNVFSIWKRGSIASDPDVPVDGYPKFLVDMAGRGGLSGAPVFRVRQGTIMEPTATGQTVGFGEKTEFVGLYSGRAVDQLPPSLRTGESSDLGFVWRADVVLEMLNSGVLDEQPEVGKGVVEMREIWHRCM
ncbi:hypothetical protein [Bradyrhizobium sp.]|uniref:hypothetical protein n=1 Tax=Bradyrhizobium sp. TaxID=376 RepID=UPI0039E50C69